MISYLYTKVKIDVLQTGKLKYMNKNSMNKMLILNKSSVASGLIFC